MTYHYSAQLSGILRTLTHMSCLQTDELNADEATDELQQNDFFLQKYILKWPIVHHKKTMRKENNNIAIHNRTT